MFRFFLVFSLSFSIFSLNGDDFDRHLMSSKGERAREFMRDFEPEIEKALQDYNVPGVSIGLIVDGELVYAKGLGLRDVEKQLPVTPETLFAIGSCTKAFTAFLVGQYVDEGALNWDTRLIDILPELCLWDFDVTYELTLRDILTHRSGLARHDFVWYNAKMSRGDLLKKLKYLEPLCSFRQRYVYGNLMYAALGVALERISEKFWEDLVKEKIIQPLEMKKTSFSVEETEQTTDYALPYTEKGKTLWRMPMRDLSPIGPAASMNSNIQDLSQWVKMHLAQAAFGGKMFLQPSTFQEILIPQIITTGAPESQETTFSAYGMGWHVSSYRGRYFISHDGISDGFTSVVGFLPHENIGIIVLSNKNLTALPRFISLQVVDHILGLPLIDWLKNGLEGLQKTKTGGLEKKRKEDPLRKVATQPSHPLIDYVGEYVHPAYGNLNVDLFNGKLQVCYNNIRYILEHWHYDVFAVEEEPEPFIISIEGQKFTFRNDIHGDIAEISFPFEPSVSDIVFQRKSQGAHTTLPYLRKFTGLYEIYGYTVEVAVRNGTLCASIPGQPTYELLPSGENEFLVKSKTGFNVRFVLDEGGKVAEVLLMQPYGTFTAKPKNLNIREL